MRWKHQSVKLEENSGVTTLTYSVEAQVGGKIAQVGSRLIDMTAKKMADIFFGKFSESISPAGSKPKENMKVSTKSSINKKLLLALGCSVAIGAILLIIF